MDGCRHASKHAACMDVCGYACVHGRMDGRNDVCMIARTKSGRS